MEDEHFEKIDAKFAELDARITNLDMLAFDMSASIRAIAAKVGIELIDASHADTRELKTKSDQKSPDAGPA